MECVNDYIEKEETRKLERRRKLKITVGGAILAHVAYKLGKAVCWVSLGNRLEKYHQEGYVKYYVDGKEVDINEVNQAIYKHYNAS